MYENICSIAISPTAELKKLQSDYLEAETRGFGTEVLVTKS